MKAFLVLVLISFQAFAHDTSGLIHRRSCPQAPELNPVPTMESLAPRMRANRVSIMDNNTVDPSNVARFMTELDKFPVSLRTEMVSRGANIRLMEGTGVGIDPTMTATRTTEGTRNWVDVPGAGGMIDNGRVVPTRIAVNHLYDKHGASNLVLHEHAHTLDSIYGVKSVSDSAVWKNLMSSTPNSSEFTKEICGQYCLDREEERFAELFAYYFACDATRQHLEEEVPQIADFFKNLSNVRMVVNGTDPRGNSPRVQLASAETKSEDCVAAEGDIPNTPAVKTITKLAPYVQSLSNSLASDPLRGYRGGNASAKGMK